MSPTTETMVCITVHDFSVSMTERLKYSLNNQNPVPFSCEHTRLPAPVANAGNSELTPPISTNGNTIPAAVNAATVAEPAVIRRESANSNGD